MKKKKILLYSLVLLIFLGVYIVIGVDSQPGFFKEPPCVQKHFEDSEIEAIAKEVANMRPYEFGEWDCSDMSSELIMRLRSIGYDANFVKGYKILENGSKSEIKHGWVEVNLVIESTTGRIIPKHEYRERYIKE